MCLYGLSIRHYLLIAQPHAAHGDESPRGLIHKCSGRKLNLLTYWTFPSTNCCHNPSRSLSYYKSAWLEITFDKLKKSSFSSLCHTETQVSWTQFERNRSSLNYEWCVKDVEKRTRWLTRETLHTDLSSPFPFVDQTESLAARCQAVDINRTVFCFI